MSLSPSCGSRAPLPFNASSPLHGKKELDPKKKTGAKAAQRASFDFVPFSRPSSFDFVERESDKRAKKSEGERRRAKACSAGSDENRHVAETRELRGGKVGLPRVYPPSKCGASLRDLPSGPPLRASPRSLSWGPPLGASPRGLLSGPPLGASPRALPRVRAAGLQNTFVETFM